MLNRLLEDNLRIIEITPDNTWREQLYQELRLPTIVYDESLQSPPAFDDILQNVLDLGCKSIVMEKDYVCADYLSEYSKHYCFNFRDMPNKCQRLHFFNTRIETTDLLSTQSILGDSYIGYMVFRPLDS